jgi:hypothetical protein
MLASLEANISKAATELDQDVQKIQKVQHPGVPWFCWSNTPRHVGYVVEIGGKKMTLPYLCYHEVKGKTYQYGTEGANRPVWGRDVLLAPTERPDGNWPNDNKMGFFAHDPTFNFIVN